MPLPLPSRSGTSSSAAWADSSADRPARTRAQGVGGRRRLGRDRAPCGGRARPPPRRRPAPAAHRPATRRPGRRRARSAGACRPGTAGRACPSARRRRGGRRRSPGRARPHVAAQVPGHRLEPRHRVDRGPRSSRAVAGEAERRVLGRDVCRPAVQVGVDAVGVGLQVLLGLGASSGTPAGRPGASRACAGTRRSARVGVLAEHLREPAGGHVAAYVHLAEPVLGLDVALREEEVAVGVGVDLRDAEPSRLTSTSADRPGTSTAPDQSGSGRRTVTTTVTTTTRTTATSSATAAKAMRRSPGTHRA